MLRTQSIEECQALVPTRSAAGTPPANTWCRAAVTTAPWLAEYLHELTVFPKGKHDLAAACLQEQDAFSPPAGGSDERTGREIGTRLCPRSPARGSRRRQDDLGASRRGGGGAGTKRWSALRDRRGVHPLPRSARRRDAGSGYRPLPLAPRLFQPPHRRGIARAGAAPG